MKKITCFVMALALVLGLSQCKKEQPLEPTNEGNGVRITLNVENDGNSGSRVNVTDNHVTFEKGDKILVGYDGKYVGYLTHDGTKFSGSINASGDGTKKLYFFFAGNKVDVATLTAGTDTECSVNISNQTAELPVLSFSESNEDFAGAGSYTASLHNQCALVKFPLQNEAGSVCISGMHTEATISFATPSITKTATTGTMRLYSVSDTEKWAILLPQSEVTTDVVIGGTIIAITVPEIIANKYVTNIPQINNSTVSSLYDLGELSGDYEAKDGDILTDTLANNVKISIAAGATVTLRDVNINENGTWTSGNYAGITCEGDATIILEGTNIVKGFYKDYPGVQAGPTNTTLTIQGSGTLNATGGSDGAAGIGSGMNASCGNITINGGTIIATGGPNGAGIGTGYTNAQGSGNISCGIITITGGTVTAYGGENAAGIGTGQSRHGTQIRRNECGGVNISGGMVTATGGENGAGIGSGYGRGTRYNPISYCGDINITGGTVVATGGSNSAGIGTGNTYTFGNSNCGNITITPGVTSVTATKGTSARDSIGRGKGKGTCGTVMFGDKTIYDGSLWIIAPESGSAYGGLSFSITTVTNPDDTWVLQPE